MFLHQLFFYLTILLLPTQLGLHGWPDWALVLGRRIDYLSPTLFLTDITCIATLLMWIGFPHKTIKTLPWMLSWKTIALAFGMLVYIASNIFFSASPYVVIFRWLKVLEFVLFGYYIIQTKPSFGVTSLVITVSMMYSSLIAIMQFVFQHSIGGIFWYLGERSFDVSTAGIARVDWCWLTATNCMELLRPYATFPHPNVLAGFLAITICISLWQLLSHHIGNKKIRIWYWITISVSCIALILTFSRGVWLMSIIAILTMLGVLYKKTVTQTLSWIFLISLTCIIMALPYFLSLMKQSESVSMRNELALAALAMWKSYPLIGVGFNAFLIHLPTVLPARYLFFLQPPHSIYLLMLSELGIIGVGSIGWFIYALIKKLLRLPNKFPLIILLLYGLLGTIDHYPVTLQQGQLLTTFVVTLSFLSK